MRTLARVSPFALFGLVALVAAGCATTRIVETWKAPGLSAADLDFQHVVAIALMPEESRARIVEDALTAAATRTKVTPAYSIVSLEDRADVGRMRGALEEQGIDGAVVVRLVGVDEEQTYVPGTVVPGGFYGYYGRVGAVMYEPGYVRTDKYYTVETSLYDVHSGKLLWSGISETLNPRDTDDLIEEIVAAARKKLREEGLLP